MTLVLSPCFKAMTWAGGAVSEVTVPGLAAAVSGRAAVVFEAAAGGVGASPGAVDPAS